MNNRQPRTDWDQWLAAVLFWILLLAGLLASYVMLRYGV